jgi:hypothetical protein
MGIMYAACSAVCAVDIDQLGRVMQGSARGERVETLFELFLQCLDVWAVWRVSADLLADTDTGLEEDVDVPRSLLSTRVAAERSATICII